MKRNIWKIMLVFIIVIAVIEIRFTPNVCADGPFGEDMIPEHYALFWIAWGGGISGVMKLKKTLLSNGWNENNIKIFHCENATYNILKSEIKNWLGGDEVQPMDTVLIHIRAHGHPSGTWFEDYDELRIYYETNLNPWLDEVKSTNMALLIESCYSGGVTDPDDNASLVEDGRVIIASSNGYDDCPEMAGILSYGLDVFGDYCPSKGNKDGVTSLKEAYNYSQYEVYCDSDEYIFKDCYPTINNSNESELHLTFQNWTNGRVDQITNKNCITGSYKVVQWYNDNISKVAQHFITPGSKLTKIRILMEPIGDPEHEIRVSIRKELNGDNIACYNISADDMDPYSPYKTFDFNMNTPYYSYYFVCEPTGEENNSTQYYSISYSSEHYGGNDYSAYEWNSSEQFWKNIIVKGKTYDLQFVTYVGVNEPPHIPKRPGGPNKGLVNHTYDYYIKTTDANGDDVTYNVSWGDGTYGEYGPNASGEIVCINHTWNSNGTYFVKVKAKDEHNIEGDWSDIYVVTIISNDPPDTPYIDGPTEGKAGEKYNYTFSTTDPDGNDVSYFIDWGDGQNESTTFHPSGEEVTVSHTWEEQGTYTIKAKAKDKYEYESDWGYLTVKMPRNIFGYTLSGTPSQNIKNKITGSHFTMLANGTADNITAHIQTNLSISPKTKCVIYRKDDSKLIGTTEEKILNTGENGAWVTYNFSDKPTLVKDTEYILACLSNDTCNLSYSNITYDHGRYKNHTYEIELDNYINWTSNESRNYSIFCRYTTIPDITNVYTTPDIVGFGYNVTISADINDNGGEIDNATVNITYPNNATGNFTMNNTGNYTYEYVFSDTWLVGQYNFTIWAVDKSGSANSSSEYSFNVSAQATISVCTVKESYGNNTIVNITDPPCNPSLIGYELLDDGKILHIWNKYDSYYFDTSSGIQLTNHYNKYWSHNVLMLGYYNNGEWNLIYRTDELSGFNKEIDSDNETYVNATLWKDLTYGGYDFRLAIRYHLGVDDNELTVIPYIKNLDEDDIPYVLGFGWEMKDIQIDMTPGGDYIEVNQTMYYLNQTLDNVYTDLTKPEFYLRENTTGTSTKSLYLKWKESLTYKLQVKSRTGQYNAPVTLFVRIGTLDSGQEKHTKMYWYDADQATFYFNNYSTGEAWATNPSYMVDGNPSNTASATVDGDVELCDGNNCSGSDLGTISKVELRVSAFYTGDPRDTILRPVFSGSTDGVNYPYQTPPGAGPVWSPWFDITDDPFAPQSWSWTDVQGLDCDVEAGYGMLSFTLYCSQVEIRVTYTPYTPPEISNPYPSEGDTGISISPTLNITVSDAGGDSMNITWLSNSSGSWQVFGTNNSVGNGTYHQTMSNASVNGQWWYWKVNVTDGINFTESSVYRFYTGYESKINNTGSTSIKGYLLMQIQFYNETSESWVVADDTVNESSPRTVLWKDPGGSPGQHLLALDTIFNGLVNTSSLSGFGSGTYRVYAAFRDPDGMVLVCDDESLMEDSYTFTINYD